MAHRHRLQLTIVLLLLFATGINAASKGQACTVDQNCDFDLYCNANKCASRLTAGSSCSRNRMCISDKCRTDVKVCKSIARRLATGVIIAIAIGAAVGAVLICLVSYCLCCRK